MSEGVVDDLSDGSVRAHLCPRRCADHPAEEVAGAVVEPDRDQPVIAADLVGVVGAEGLDAAGIVAHVPDQRLDSELAAELLAGGACQSAVTRPCRKASSWRSGARSLPANRGELVRADVPPLLAGLHRPGPRAVRRPRRHDERRRRVGVHQGSPGMILTGSGEAISSA